MLNNLSRIVVVTFSLVIFAVMASSCEVNSTGASRWQKLPELKKPVVAKNIDMGGEFRVALENLEKIKLEDEELIKIVVTFWDMAYFAGGLSANLVETRIVAEKGANLYQFKPDRDKVLSMMSDAHVVFKIGYGLDDWIDPLFDEAKKGNPELVLVNLTRNVELIGDLWNPNPYKAPPIEKYNPWFWMNPDNIISIADTFYQVFYTFRPEKDELMRKGSETLQHNMAIFPSSQFQLSKITGKVVIQDVPVWPYFAKYFDLTIHATLMEDGFTDPDESYLKKLADEIKENEVIAIIKTNGYGNGIADKFAELTGLPIIELDPHPGMQTAGMTDYFQQIMGNTNRLLKNFREIGLPEKEVEVPKAEPEKTPTAEVEISEEMQKQLAEQMKKQAEEEGTE